MSFRSTLRVTAALFAVLSLAAVAHADPTADAKKAIQAAYDKADAALVKKDLKGMFAVYSPDYEAEFKGQKMTLATVQQQAQMQISMIQKPKNKVTIQKFALKGKEATVTTKQDMEASIENPQTKKTSKVAISSTSEDLWVKGAKGWLIKHSKVLAMKQSLDGKPMPGM